MAQILHQWRYEPPQDKEAWPAEVLIEDKGNMDWEVKESSFKHNL
jgi:hypothetical protein